MSAVAVQGSGSADSAEACLKRVRTERRRAERSHGRVPDALLDELDAARRAVRASLDAPDGLSPADIAARLDLLAAIGEERRALAEAETDARFDALARIHASLRRLRDCPSPAALIESAPRELRLACGFSRTMISRVRGSMWVPEVLDIEEGMDPEGGDAFVRYVEEAEIPLEHMLLETELVRRRFATLVTDVAAKTWPAIAEVSRSESYVVAPIMPTRRVIGFFHADRFGQGRPVDERDRDNLWVFTEHFGLLYERLVLVDRLERQRSEVREALTRAAAAIDEICGAEVALARHEPVPEAPRIGTGAGATPSRLDTLLTPREREVLELMASGATNTLVARQLVVSEGTVKSHVKRILRKLHVSNRAEAVARYLHLKMRETEGGRP